MATVKTMPKVLMYCTALCPFCTAAERLLRARGVSAIDKIRVDLDAARLQEMMAITRRRTVPQIFIGDIHIGGFDDLAMLDHQGRLAELLAGQS